MMVYFQRFQLFGHFHPTGAVELVPDLPPSLGVWWHPDPHACHQDGRPLQAGLRPPRRLPWPASARLVPDGHASEAGLLPDAVRQAGEAGRREAVVCVHTSVDHVTGSIGGAGSEYFPWEERGLIPGPLENLKVNRSAINRSHIVCEPMMFPERIHSVVTAQEPVFILKITFPLTEIQQKDWNEKVAIKSHITHSQQSEKKRGINWMYLRLLWRLHWNNLAHLFLLYVRLCELLLHFRWIPTPWQRPRYGKAERKCF